MKSFPHIIRKTRRLALAGVVAGLFGTTAIFAQNEDEWYDPTDWFDGNNVEADDTFDTYGYYDYDYDYGFDDTYDYGDDWTAYDTWGEDLWDSDYYDANYWNDYDWSDDELDRTYTFIAFVEPVNQQQQGAQQRQSQSGQPASKQKEKAQKEQVAKLNGTIEAISDIRLKRGSGATGTYKIAKVRLENGKTTVVNLGRASKVEKANLKKGDSIQALGRKGQIANETIFVAHKLKAGGRTLDANPTIRLARDKMIQSQQQKTLQGTVADVRKASSGTDSQHTLVNVSLENGKSATVDFGPAASLDAIGVREGQSVTIRGQMSQVNGREVLVPSLLKVEGEEIASVTE